MRYCCHTVFLQDHIEYETLARYDESSHLKQKDLEHKQNGGICWIKQLYFVDQVKHGFSII
jgi:hypothetical protein